jgi:hypothetical protein
MKPLRAPARRSFAGPAATRAAVVVVLLAAMAPSASTAADEALANWFDDPFFAIAAEAPDCPLPAGPFVSEADKRVQAHRRAEKGTTCWLAKVCDRPNAYAYDPDIATAFQDAVRAGVTFPGASLWVTVQGRVVYIEGCAPDAATVERVEALARSLRYVEQAMAIVRTDPHERLPYRPRQPLAAPAPPTAKEPP